MFYHQPLWLDAYWVRIITVHHFYRILYINIQIYNCIYKDIEGWQSPLFHLFLLLCLFFVALFCTLSHPLGISIFAEHGKDRKHEWMYASHKKCRHGQRINRQSILNFERNSRALLVFYNRFNAKILTSIVILIIKMRWSHDRLLCIMGIPIPGKTCSILRLNPGLIQYKDET